jgi:hypothetical protein
MRIPESERRRITEELVSMVLQSSKGEESNNASHYSAGAMDSRPAEGGAVQGEGHQVHQDS